MKRQLLFIAIIGLMIINTVNAQIVTNGGYENWTSGNPDNWTSDSGITVTEETTTIHGGTSSASVDVTTGSQASTDFRQNVNVVSGHTYSVSVWIKHTEGNMKARLYVDGYRGYSDNTNTTSWQEMTYSYSATSTASISIGLRFYDQSGFDGAEIVYVDDYSMVDDAGGNSPPSISSIAHSPSSGISSSTTVSVSADVTDSDGTISNVELHWGTASGSLGTTISMSNTSGDTYQTDTDIPAQADGTTVYYEVEATDDDTDVTTSSEYNYEVTDSSSASDILLDYGWSEPTNIDYTAYQTASSLTTTNSIEVAKFTLRDGSGSSDADALATILTDITLQINNYANIRALALFSGSTNISELTTVVYNSTFSGISGFQAADNDSIDFSLRATFNTNVEDNDNLRFLITSAIASSSGSDFAVSNAGGALTDNTGNNNKIVVTADRLAITNPTNIVINSDFPITITATDVNGNTDVDETSNVSLTEASGTGSLSSVMGLTQALSTGTYSWSDVQYDVAEDFTIEGQSATLTNITSGTISAAASQNLDLLFSEICDPKDASNAKFVELYNAGSTTIDFSVDDWYITRQANGSGLADVQLSGSVAAGETYVVAYQTGTFQTTYGFAADQGNTYISGNGDDGYYLYEGGNHNSGTLMDSYGVIDEDGTTRLWEYMDGHAVRNRNIIHPNNTWTASEWAVTTISYGTGSNASQMTPGRHKTSINWDGSASTDWNDTTNWSTSYVPDASDIVYIVSATNKPIITSDAMAFDLDIAADMSLEVSAGKYLTVNGTLANNNELVLKSDATGTAGLLAQNDQDVKVETYIFEDSWHMVAPMVDNDSSGVFVDLYLLEFIENDSTWNYINPLDIDLNLGKSYFVWSASSSTGDATVSHEGTFVHGDIGVNLDYTSAATHDGKGWTMVGNPYTCSLTLDSEWTFNNVGETIYIWDDVNGNYQSINTSGVGTADSILAVGQGFWMRATATNPSITIPQSERRHFNNNLSKSSASRLNQVTFYVQGNEGADAMTVQFNKEASTGFDAKYDAYKMRGKAGAPQLYMLQNELELTTNILPYKEGMTIAVNFEAGTNGMCHFSMENNQYEGDIYLEDLQTNNIVNISENSYSFYASTEDDVNRFVIHFSSPNAIVENSTNPINIYSDGENLIINSTEELNTNIAIYDLLGQKISSHTIHGKESRIILPSISGYVLVKVLLDEEVYSAKVFVR